MGLNKTTENAKVQLNILFRNMFEFDDADMAGYDACYADAFRQGVNFSYMSTTFYAQFAAELFIGMMASSELLERLVKALDEEKADIGNPVVYWDESMNTMCFGIPGKDYEEDIKDLNADVCDIVVIV